MAKYYPDGSLQDTSNVFGYAVARTVVQALKQAGDNLTRENVMKQMSSIKDLQMAMMLSGIKWNTSASDYFLIESAQLFRFDGKEWVGFGKIIGR